MKPNSSFYFSLSTVPALFFFCSFTLLFFFFPDAFSYFSRLPSCPCSTDSHSSLQHPQEQGSRHGHCSAFSTHDHTTLFQFYLCLCDQKQLRKGWLQFSAYSPLLRRVLAITASARLAFVIPPRSTCPGSRLQVYIPELLDHREPSTALGMDKSA